MKIYMTSRVHQKIWYYIMAVNTEIGGMGYLTMLPDSGGDMLLHEVFLCPQVATQGGVDFDEFGGDEFAINKAIEDGVLSDPQHVWFSWHSHGNTGTFWSTTDDKRIEALHAAGIPHLVSFVGNRKREYKVRYDAFDLDHHGCSIPQLTVDNVALYLDPDDETFSALQDEVDEMLRKPAPRQITSGPAPSAWAKRSTSSTPAPERRRPATWKNGQWYVDDKPVRGTLQTGPLTESEQADSAFSVEPVEGEDLPVLVGPADEIELTDDEKAWLAGWSGYGSYGVD